MSDNNLKMRNDNSDGHLDSKKADKKFDADRVTGFTFVISFGSVDRADRIKSEV